MAGRICIVVGHGKSESGGYDSGAVGFGYHEFKIAREIAKHAQAELQGAYGAQCDLMNYNGDLYLQERINKLKTDYYDFIAEIHLNAGGGTGTEVYYCHTDATGKKYAEAIAESISGRFGIRNRGAKIKLNSSGKDYFGIIRSTKPTAVLVETVFIDTKTDLEKVNTETGQKACGQAIADAIARVRGLTKTEESNTETSTGGTKTLYHVQTGAFTKKENADALAAKLKAAGFDTYMVQSGGYYKVQVGAYSVKENADAMAAKLKAAGYDTYITKKSGDAVATPAKKTVDELAREVLAGKWGNGATRKQKLTAAGYDYSAVQKRVNELLKQ